MQQPLFGAKLKQCLGGIGTGHEQLFVVGFKLSEFFETLSRIVDGWYLMGKDQDPGSVGKRHQCPSLQVEEIFVLPILLQQELTEKPCRGGVLKGTTGQVVIKLRILADVVKDIVR